MLEGKIKYETIGTNEDNLVGDKDVLLSMWYALCFTKIPRIWFSEQIRNLKRITTSVISTWWPNLWRGRIDIKVIKIVFSM